MNIIHEKKWRNKSHTARFIPIRPDSWQWSLEDQKVKVILGYIEFQQPRLPEPPFKATTTKPQGWMVL